MKLDKGHGKDTLNKFRKGELPTGLGLNVPYIDEYIKFKRANFTIVAGLPNVGKTYWMLWYFLMLNIRHGLKWCIYSSENEIWVLKMFLVQFYTKSPISKLDEKTYLKAFNYIDEKFTFISTDELYELENLLEVFKTVDVDGYLIDPHNSLDIPASVTNQHLYDYRMASMMRNFCKTNDKSLYLTAHGVTEAQRKTHGKGHEFEGHQIPLLSADIEGGGKWANRADDLYTVHRYFGHPDPMIKYQTLVHVRKIKVTETGGTQTSLDYPIKLDHSYNGFHVGEIDIYNKAKTIENMEIDGLTSIDKLPF